MPRRPQQQQVGECRAQTAVDRDDVGFLVLVRTRRDPHRPARDVRAALGGELRDAVRHVDVVLEVAHFQRLLLARAQAHETPRVGMRLRRDRMHGAQRASHQWRQHLIAMQRTRRQARIEDVAGNPAIAAAEQQVRPQLGLHDQRREGTVVIEEAPDRTGQVVGQVDMLDLVLPQRAHALGPGRRDGGDQQAQVGMGATQRLHQRQRGIHLAHRHRVHPQRARMHRIVVADSVALRPALQVGRLAEAAPDQVIDRDGSNQVQGRRIQDAQEALDEIRLRYWRHRRRITKLPPPSLA